MTTHEIIEATENPCGGVSLTIRWSAGTTTTQYYGSEAAKALGWKRPDPQPVDPAWMVEVATEAVAASSGRPQPVTEYIVAALRLALSRGHVVLAPVMPSEEEMLKAAREDAAQVNDGRYPDTAASMRVGDADGNDEVKLALQARRNVYASLRAVKALSSGPAVPEADLREALKRAWTDGFGSAASALDALAAGEGDAAGLYARKCDGDVSAILEDLKSGEA